MAENQFDSFRRMGLEALKFSTAWMSYPTRTARQFCEHIFAYSLGGRLEHAPSAVSQSLYTSVMIASRWAMCGFPTITIGHKTAAALCATKMRPEDAVEFVRPPWPAFCIRLPNGLLSISDNGLPRDAQVLVVTALEPGTIEREGNKEQYKQPADQHRWWYKLAAASVLDYPSELPARYASFFEGISLWGFNQATQYMASPDAGQKDLNYVRWETHPADDSDTRCERLARALILSTCMYLSGDPRELAQRASEGGISVTSRKSKKRDGDELPQYTNFEITSSIKVNMAEAVREYIRHGGSSPTIQTHVQGHWKRVPYGPGGKQRKLTHVQAYWRGELGLPISARVK